MLLAFVSLFGLVSAYPLILDGSFEENCAIPSCVFNPDTTIGNDWNLTAGANKQASLTIIEDADPPLIATDGSYYGYLERLISNNATVTLKNLQVLNGGIIFRCK
jgi:hypothetical protein